MKFLIVVDMQNDFITGSLGTKEAEDILPKVLEKIRTYRPEQIFCHPGYPPGQLSGDQRGASSPGGSLHRRQRGARSKSAGGGGAGGRACRPLYLQAHLWLHPAGGKSSRPPPGPKPRRSSWWVCAPASVCFPTPSCAKRPSGKGRRFRGRCLLRLRHAQSHDTALSAMKLCQIDINNQGSEPWRP